MNVNEDAHFKKTIQYDVHKIIGFRCPIGKTEAVIGIMIEPDPHGDESGTDSHFHSIASCPKMKIVDFPEPDRCSITDSTCPFTAPIDRDETNPEQRKFRYASTIIQKIAFIEVYGSQLVNEILKKKKLKPVSIRVAELEKILVTSDLIDAEMYQKLGKLRHMRNEFAHSPNGHLKFTEKDLYDSSMEADKLSSVVAELLKKISIENKSESP